MQIITKAMKLFSLPLITLLLANVLLHAQAPTTWVIGTQYNSGSIVGYEDNFYRAIQDVPGSVGGTPDTLTDYWVDIFSTKPTVDPEDPPTTEPDTSDSDLGNLTPPEDNSSNDDPSGATDASSVSFVKQQYIDFLGRDGAESGIQFWSEKLDNNLTTRADVVNNFVFSDEFQNKVAPVSRLYLAFFLRPPNTEGLQYWIDQNAKGISLEDIASSFASSPEFITRYGNLTNSEYVNLVFSNVLERTPADSGLAYWANALDNGNSKGSVMLGFSEGPEYRNKSLSEVRTIAFYYGLLRRAPAIEGFEYWSNLLDIGASPNDLINGFLNSNEYQNRF
jgi:hypothetical protein